MRASAVQFTSCPDPPAHTPAWRPSVPSCISSPPCPYQPSAVKPPSTSAPRFSPTKFLHRPRDAKTLNSFSAPLNTQHRGVCWRRIRGHERPLGGLPRRRVAPVSGNAGTAERGAPARGDRPAATPRSSAQPVAVTRLTSGPMHGAPVSSPGGPPQEVPGIGTRTKNGDTRNCPTGCGWFGKKVASLPMR